MEEKTNLANYLRLWFPVVIWAAFIFYLSSIPDLRSNFECDFILRKVSHVVEYFILAFLLYRAFSGSFNKNILYLLIYPASLSILYAMSDELHQSIVPGRSCSIQDVLIDTIGIITFFVINIFVLRKIKRVV